MTTSAALCTHDTGYCPSGDWYQSFQTAVDTYAKANKDVYGCSFGNQYNYGYQAAPDTQGGYVCFKTEVGGQRTPYMYSCVLCGALTLLLCIALIECMSH